MNIISEKFLSDQFPQDEIEKSYEKIVYKNVKLLENGKYESKKVSLNPLEYQQYIISNEYKQQILFDGNTNMVGNYSLANSVNEYKQIKVLCEKDNLIFEYEITTYDKNYCFEVEGNKIIVNLKDANLNLILINEKIFIKKVIGLK